MTYQINSYLENDVLIFEVKGQRDMQESIKLWHQVNDKIKSNKISKIIVELLLKGTFKENRVISAIALLAEIFSETEARIAVVDHNPESLSTNKMGFHLLNVDSRARFEVFDNFIESLKWLNNES